MEFVTSERKAMQPKSKLPIAAFYFATACSNAHIRRRVAVGSHDVYCRPAAAFNDVRVPWLLHLFTWVWEYENRNREILFENRQIFSFHLGFHQHKHKFHNQWLHFARSFRSIDFVWIPRLNDAIVHIQFWLQPRQIQLNVVFFFASKQFDVSHTQKNRSNSKQYWNILYKGSDAC